MRPRLLMVLGAVILSAQACATKPFEYGPIGEKQPFGYKDSANADGGHTVLVVMPPITPAVEVRTVWNRRAEELCPAGVEKRNIFRLDRREYFVAAQYVYQGTGVSSRGATAMEAEGYVYCKPEPTADTAEAVPKAATP